MSNKKPTNETSLVNEIFKKPSMENMTICDAIILVAEGVNGNNYDDKKSITEQKEALSKVSEYLGTNEIQTLIFCGLYIMQFDSGTQLKDIARFLGMTPVSLLRYNAEIEKMVELGLIEKEVEYDRFDESKREEYKVTQSVLNCIKNNKRLSIKKNNKKEDVYYFLEGVDSVLNRNRAPNLNNTVRDMEELEEEFKTEAYVKKLKTTLPNSIDRFIIYSLTSQRIIELDIAIGAIIRRFYSGADKGRYKKLLIDGNHPLQKEGFIELEPAEFVDKSNVYITKKGLGLVLGEDAMCFSKENETEGLDVILPEKITTKELYYGQEEQSQLSTITNAFDDENFKALQNRLEKKGMHKGVAVLFYGAPGTGKTESVLQIARKTGRAVYQVDISETKTKWFGESERLTKRIFTGYKQACEDARCNGRKTPILFINEADAIISKRRELGDNGCGQTENALQNIFLEEIENLEGILIATTNLATNMDSAFDRRFLFKVKFEKPEPLARTKIWQTKLSFLSEEDARRLADRFEFSGGQIDNIARKIEIDEVVSGITPNIEAIVDMCGHEVLEMEKGERRIGFTA